MAGFFEESAGVRSMTRLVMFILTLLSAVVTGAIVVYVFRCEKVEPEVILALVGALGALVLNGVVAIAKR
jgi:hypothetical protein